jgi:hypothetical protein
MRAAHASRRRPSTVHAGAARLVPRDAYGCAGGLARLHIHLWPASHVDVPGRVVARAEPPDPRPHTHTPLESYLASSRVQFSRLVMLAVCMQAIVVAGLLWEETVLLQAVGGAAHGGRHGARRGRWERLGVAAVPRCAHAAAAPRSRRGYFSTRCGEKAPTATAGSGASVESGTSEPWFAFPPSYVRIGDVAQGSTESVICRYLARRLPRHPILAKRATCFAFAATIKTGTCAAFAAVFRSMCSALSVGRESGSVTELLFFPRPGP